MTTSLEWPEVALRLALAVVAGGVLGINRTEHGMKAGLRTTLLVTLAAAVAMAIRLLAAHEGVVSLRWTA
jgi:putative Mg2+ transporter-C (MgtC) family protein